jgi:hypothetical protein
MKEIVTDNDVQKALDFLRHEAQNAAEAKAHRLYMVEYRKTMKANMMQMHLNKPVAAQEREAYRAEEYIAHLDALKAAITQDVYFEWKRAAAEATIEAWRTLNANRRGEGKLQ